MDKVKINFTVIIAVLVVVCIVLMGYVASLNSQLSAEKTRTLQLDDQIAGLNSKAGDLRVQLTKATAQVNSQTGLAANLQATLDKVNAELADLKTAYSDLESKLKAQVSVPLN